jgi:hypothetical protein
LKHNDEPLRYLAADQLIKHAVGLLNTYPWKNWRLIYLWYDSGSGDDKAHQNELERFEEAIGDDFRFENITYQALFSRLCETQDTSTSGWANYMRERYF